MKMKIMSDEFRVVEGDEVELAKWPTKVKPGYRNAAQYRKLLQQHIRHNVLTCRTSSDAG
jgi:hypothetical protein